MAAAATCCTDVKFNERTETFSLKKKKNSFELKQFRKFGHISFEELCLRGVADKTTTSQRNAHARTALLTMSLKFLVVGTAFLALLPEVSANTNATTETETCNEGKLITIARSPPASTCSNDSLAEDDGAFPRYGRSCSGPLHPFVVSTPEDETEHGTIKVAGDNTEYVASGLTITEDMIIYIDYDGIVAEEYTPECTASAG